ncbi:MAG: hydantoinase/oxoprolinase family protein [Rhodospirillaceae bacterium]|nr:hydantoinase/oxoprolinase family protein [Rhodospirillaceae bacterium]
MAILLGLDTGGTYTDAVLFDPVRGEDAGGVLAKAKSLTTKHDLAIGLTGAVEAILPHLPAGRAIADIAMVSISTTLATNAIVEKHGAPICLILMGYDAKALERAGLRQAMAGDPVVMIAGGHKPTGEAQSPLDVEALRAAIQEHAPKVAAFAVSGYFSVRNPAHEIAARHLIHEMTGKPVTCGHELTSKLDAPRRALTAALNARLIPQLQQLIQAVDGLLARKGIKAPLMVVKGDGSLIKAELALTCPVETILSGPAASLVGARHLSQESDIFVSDMGGTTTDIAMLREGRPVLNKEGATVGGWKTMVEAVAVHTYGLGGDSEVRVDEHHGFMVGPRRAVPLSLLATQFPAIVNVLRAQQANEELVPYRGQFALRQRPLDAGPSSLSAGQLDLWEKLAHGPVALADLLFSPATQRHLGRLVDRGLVAISGLTPSDAAHVLGLLSHWHAEAAELGARLFLKKPPVGHWKPPASHEQLCRDIVEQVVRQSGEVILDAAIRETSGIDPHHWGQLGRDLIRRSLSAAQPVEALIESTIRLTAPLAAIGAPVGSYYPEIARRLKSRLVIPPHADVCNAVGAVAGGVLQRANATITQPQEGLFRVHHATGIKDFVDLEQAAAYCDDLVRVEAGALAQRAGAVEIQIKSERADKVFEQPTGLRIFIESSISATAFGRPGLV